MYRSRSSMTERGASNAEDEGASPFASASLGAPSAKSFPIIPISQGVMSAVDGLVRSQEAAGANPATLTLSNVECRMSNAEWRMANVKCHQASFGIRNLALGICGRQADISWLHLSRKQDRH